MSREAMQMALEALEDSNDVARMEFGDEDYYSEAINALRQALVDADDTSQKRVDEMVKTEHGKKIEIALAYQRGWDAAVAQQEPVAWMYVNEDGECEQIEYGPVFDDPGVTPLYTAPPKKEWVGLTAYEIQEIHSGNQHWGNFACAIEAKLKEKNHG
jgi:hypothetical protein